MDFSAEATVEAFRALGAGGIAGTVDPFEGALLVARLVDPEADVAAARRRVDALAERVAARRAGGREGIAALRAVLFDEEGFRGDSESYDAPPNCSIVHALETRRGMPITLSVLVREVGRRAGVTLDGVGLPGHFVLGGGDLPDGVYLDAFDGGALCDAETLGRRVSGIFGTEVALPPEAFAPDPSVAIVRRMLANLRRSFERRHRFEEAIEVLDCAEALEPSDPAILRERGLLLLRAGRLEDAVAALEAHLARAPGADADAVRRLVAAIRERASDGAPRIDRRVFTLEEARALLPRVRERTSEAVERYARLGDGEDVEDERRSVLEEWARELSALGVEIKGPWLVDFDSGAGYYCWKYPETKLEFFHSYEEGFAGRLPLQ